MMLSYEHVKAAARESRSATQAILVEARASHFPTRVGLRWQRQYAAAITRARNSETIVLSAADQDEASGLTEAGYTRAGKDSLLFWLEPTHYGSQLLISKTANRVLRSGSTNYGEIILACYWVGSEAYWRKELSSSVVARLSRIAPQIGWTLAQQFIWSGQKWSLKDKWISSLPSNGVLWYFLSPETYERRQGALERVRIGYAATGGRMPTCMVNQLWLELSELKMAGNVGARTCALQLVARFAKHVKMVDRDRLTVEPHPSEAY